jgi:hypothetical protein
MKQVHLALGAAMGAVVLDGLVACGGHHHKHVVQFHDTAVSAAAHVVSALSVEVVRPAGRLQRQRSTRAQLR